MKRRGVRVVAQRKPYDCGVAALAMLIGRPYGDVAALVRELVEPAKLRRRGTTIADLSAIAGRLGASLRPVHRARGYLEAHGAGILGMIGGQMDRAGHWVVWKAGAVVDPDGGEVWALEDYLRRFRCRSTVLLVEGER